MTDFVHRMTLRDKRIVAGLYFSKFDEEGLAKLGFTSFKEAFNALGYALEGEPRSIRNYRDEFDPLFPNPRKGWVNRPRRKYCLEWIHRFGDLSLPEFSAVVTSFFAVDSVSTDRQEVPDDAIDSEIAFARRLITGRAAELYFQSRFREMNCFSDYELEDTTLQGCGYDFRLWPPSSGDFLAVEVKGLKERRGSISMTDKEFQTAGRLRERFYLLIVKNFSDKPFHEIHQNPVFGGLGFDRNERLVRQISWRTTA